MASPKKTLPSRIVVPGVRTPKEVGGGTGDTGDNKFLLFGDPNDICRFLNREGFTANKDKLHFCAQDVNAILVVASK